jgi:formate dehydrogenase iron-sulfur subunit
MAVRGQFANAFSGRDGALFVAEILLGAVVPLALLARPSARTQQSMLALGAFLTTTGIVFNRVNVVLFAMHLKGSMPQISPEPYRPTVIEWGISIGLIAATIFLFGLGARLMPVLPKEEVHVHV